MKEKVRAEWMLVINALEEGIEEFDYDSIAEGWSILMENGTIDPEEAGYCLYLMEQENLLTVESEESYDPEFGEGYFPTDIQITDKGRLLIKELTGNPVLTKLLEGIKKADDMLLEFKNASPTIREALDWVVVKVCGR